MEAKQEATRPCPRCLTGIDDDGDGNCGVCARLSDIEARKLREYAVLLALVSALERSRNMCKYYLDHKDLLNFSLIQLSEFRLCMEQAESALALAKKL